MFATRPIRLFVLFALLAVLGFAFAAWTAGAVAPVMVGTLGVFAAAASFVAEIDGTRKIA
jgi:hypothetical protein